MKTYKIEVEIVNAKLEVLDRVIGKGLGLLAVTPIAFQEKARARNITHVPTGAKLKYFATQQEALAELPKWVDATDWDFYGTDSGKEPKIRKAFEAVKAAGLR